MTSEHMLGAGTPGKSLRGLVAALLADDGRTPWPAAVPGRLERVLAAMPGPARAGIRAAAAAVDAYAAARYGRRLADLSPEERERVLGSLTARPALVPLLDAVKVPVLLAAGTERMAAHQRMAHRRMPRQRKDGPWEGGPWDSRPQDVLDGARPTPPGLPDDPPLDCVPSSDWPSRTTADAVVIGSGAGGAMAALTLARAGLSVVVLEEGRHHSTASFRERTPLDRFTDLYRDGGATVAIGNPPVIMPVGRAVGGTTVINSGTCYRTPEHVVARWRERYGVAFADGLDGCLDEVEQILRVATGPLDVLGSNGRIALAGAERLGWRAAPLRRNAPGCVGLCQCVVGCPAGAKQSVQLSVLPDACAAGARIVTQARVRRILTDADGPGGPRAAGVEVRRPDGTALEILSPLVVVAAGALETPPLLRRSGLGGHPRLGRGLAVHPATSVAGRFSEPVLAWRGVLQSVGVEELHRDGILVEATAAPPGMGSLLLPGAGRELRRELEGVDHLATLGAMIADRPSGRVLGRRRAVLRYDLDPRDGARLVRSVWAMAQLLFAAGAREVLTGIAGAPRVQSLDELSDVLARVTARQLHISAFHPTGTVAAGADPQAFPTDPHGWLRGVRGVLVTDGSILPSCPEVNPQLTIMAAALATSRMALCEPESSAAPLG